MIENEEKMDHTTTTIFELEAHTNKPVQSATDAGGTDDASQTLAEFITAQFAD